MTEKITAVVAFLTERIWEKFMTAIFYAVKQWCGMLQGENKLKNSKCDSELLAVVESDGRKECKEKMQKA